MKFNDFLNEQLKNEELRKEYDKLTPEYEIISAIIKARNEKGLTQLELAKTIIKKSREQPSQISLLHYLTTLNSF